MHLLASAERPLLALPASAPSRPVVAFQAAIREAAPLVVFEVPTSFGSQPWSFRDPGRSPLWRFFAHVLIRLLVIAPLPPPLQAAAVLFPVSILWPLVRVDEVKNDDKTDSVEEPASARPGGGSSGSADRTRAVQILLGTARSVFGGTDPLGGVRTATLGRIAIIEKIKPTRVVVDQTKKAAEAFEVKYKVIPADSEVQSAQLELRSADLTYQSQAAPLTNGSGATSFPIGTDLGRPAPEVRLLVNPGASEELLGFPKRLEVAKVQVGPNEAVQVSADDAALSVITYSDAHLGRFMEALSQGAPNRAPPFTWEAVGSSASLSPNPMLLTTGVSEALLKTGTTPGAVYRLQGRLPDSGVLGVSADIEVVAGRAKNVSLAADKAAVPADETSEVILTLVARDQFGNLVQDGTPVSWIVDGKGVVEPAETPTTNGQATAKYRAGDVAGEAAVVARIDNAEARATIELAAIEVTVSPAASVIAVNAVAPLPVTITATSSAGPPAASAPLLFRATLGTAIAPATLVDGQAVASFRPFGHPGQARLFASVGTQSGEAAVEVARPAGFFVAPQQRGFVGNRTEDGTATGEDLDGNIKTYSYRTSTTLSVTGTPGDVVDIKLGGFAGPNVEPAAWYPMDDPLADGVVVDEYHDHPGKATDTGVAVDFTQKSTGAASLRFDGTGRVDIQDNAAFALAGELGLALDFRVEAAQAATLLSKAGAYGLALVEDGGVRVRAFVNTASGERAVVSAPVALGGWHSAMAFLKEGTLVLNVDGVKTSVPVADPVETAMGPLVLGEGLAGNLDNLRMYDFTRPKLMAFEDGSDTTSVTIGSTGQATVPVRSLGNLRNSSPNAARVEVVSNVRAAYLSEQSGFLWTWTVELLISVFLVVEGAVVGDPDSVEAFAGDMIASFFVFGDVRDLLIALYRHAVGTATTGDYFVLVLAILGIATTITVVGDFFVTALKDAMKVLRRIPDPVQKLFGLYAKDLIGQFLRGRGREAIGELITFFQALTKAGVADAFIKVAAGIKNVVQVRRLVQLAAKAPDAAAYLLALGRAYDVLAASAKVGAKASDYVVHIVDVVGHHLDEAAKLGKTVTSWGQDGIVGVARFLEVTDGSVANAMGLAGDFLKHYSGNLKAAEEFFTYLAKIVPRIEDVGRSGLRDFLIIASRGTNAINDLKGAYGVLRLTAEAPELAGVTIRKIHDVLKNGRQGIDLDVLSKRGIREFWEIKFHKTFSSAWTTEQVTKHIKTKILPEFVDLSRRVRNADELAAEMAKVKLKFNFIVETGGSLVDRKLMHETVQTILSENFDELVQAGFKFDLDDIVVRQGNPLAVLDWILPAALR